MLCRGISIAIAGLLPDGVAGASTTEGLASAIYVPFSIKCVRPG
jgi:hypothetical protein